VRTAVEAAEPFQLKLLVLSENPVKTALLHWRILGQKRFNQQRFQHVARGVYRVELPAPGKNDFEYYVSVETGNVRTVWPATAPQLNQTVLAW
jgi:hypothetical protein